MPIILTEQKYKGKCAQLRVTAARDSENGRCAVVFRRICRFSWLIVCFLVHLTGFRYPKYLIQSSHYKNIEGLAQVWRFFDKRNMVLLRRRMWLFPVLERVQDSNKILIRHYLLLLP